MTYNRRRPRAIKIDATFLYLGFVDPNVIHFSLK